MNKLLALCALLLAGCGAEEKTMVVVEPVSGCEYIATTYGDGGTLSGSYIKPRTDSRGKHICTQRSES